MTQEQKRIKLAEAFGWKKLKGFSDSEWPLLLTLPQKPNTEGYLEVIPDYFNDLNAVHKAESVLDKSEQGWSSYADYLEVVCGADGWPIMSQLDKRRIIHATAAQRCEALGKTLNLW